MKAFTYVTFATTLVLGVQALVTPNINKKREGEVCLLDGNNKCTLDGKNDCCSGKCYMEKGWETGVCQKTTE
ncbi:antifungal peptide domain-containing protein [Pochonia chlamydosporia 170]|uniref:Antifungal peptide domain-containing protein n=1 Tax=Pochonia chlamydosporia 170 TaxID=1380566 RepID=A0A179GA19_METCM|nr:antifungal peptide domain-containing protein [Pochonia chlamydosporia 170]OAQ74340.1 antifungal peptide domain-containing protein [Pochonia chlamydosporia 170]